jgi:hypothetical protein
VTRSQESSAAVYTTDGHGERGGCPGYTRVLKGGTTDAHVVYYAQTQADADAWIAEQTQEREP